MKVNINISFSIFKWQRKPSVTWVSKEEVCPGEDPVGVQLRCQLPLQPPQPPQPPSSHRRKKREREAALEVGEEAGAGGLGEGVREELAHAPLPHRPPPAPATRLGFGDPVDRPQHRERFYRPPSTAYRLGLGLDGPPAPSSSTLM